jgi:hypothetical protein
VACSALPSLVLCDSKILFSPVAIVEGCQEPPARRCHQHFFPGERFPRMKKVSDYRRHAEECRTLLSGAKTTEHRDMLLKMAETWEGRRRPGKRNSLVTASQKRISGGQAGAVFPRHIWDACRRSARERGRGLHPVPSLRRIDCRDVACVLDHEGPLPPGTGTAAVNARHKGRTTGQRSRGFSERASGELL